MSRRRRLRIIRRIARWEVSRSAGVLDRRTLVLALVTLLLAGGVAGVGLATDGVAVDRDIYRVGVDEGSVYSEPVAESRTLAARPPSAAAFERGDLDLLVVDGTVRVADGQKGAAALAALRSAVQGYNDRLMAREPNQTAAFPVVVTLAYRDQQVTAGTDAARTTAQGTPAAGDDGSPSDSADGPASGNDRFAVPDVGGGESLFGSSTSGSPANISPPFPFASLVLAFAFLVPMNFVIQAYGSTMLNERINRRGELLLVAPVEPLDIVTGKTLPYLGAMAVTTVGITLFVGGGLVSVGAVLPVALLFLAATFVGAMFARSFKELTFVTVAVSVFLTTYTFVPAIFTNITPIALISPLTLVVRELQGLGVDATQYAFATGPFYLASVVLFVLGAGVYREEDMFTQRSVPLKFLDALDSRIRGAWSMATLSALSIPFVFIAELLAIAVLFALPIDLSIPVLLVVIAAIEELAKSLHIYAGFHKGRFGRTARTAVVLGVLSGVGFFLGEKATAVVQLVGLPDLALGQAAFAPSGTGVVTALTLLLAPLVLHTATASISALGATRDGTWYAGTVVVATVVHALYNLTVVSSLG